MPAKLPWRTTTQPRRTMPAKLPWRTTTPPRQPAPQRRQWSTVARPLLELGRAGGDAIEHFIGFREIDVEELGIEVRGVGLEQTHGFLGWRRCGRNGASGGDCRHRLLKRGGIAH